MTKVVGALFLVLLGHVTIAEAQSKKPFTLDFQADSGESILILLSHWNDSEEVYLHQGCIVSRITVGEFAQRLLKNPDFLDP